MVEKAASRHSWSPAVIVATTAAICAPILALAQFIAHARVDEYDAWLFAYYGRQLLHGAVLYVDVWDNKPPGIFWLNALGQWLTPGSLVGVWVICGIAVALATAVFFVAVRRLYGLHVAGISTVLAAIYLNLQTFHVGCDRPNTFLVLTEIAAFALYVATLTRPSWQRWLVLAGVFGGLGLAFKQTALGASAAIVAHVVFLTASGRIPFRQALARIGLFAAGWLACVAALVGGLIATSSLDAAWYAIVGFNRLYFAPGAGSSMWPPFSWMEDHLRAMGLPLVLAGATLVHAIFRAVSRRRSGAAADGAGADHPGLLFMLWFWLVAAVYLAALGPHKRAPYLAVVLPPLMLLSAHAIHLLLAGAREAGRRVPAFHAFVAVCWVAYMVIWPLQMQVATAARQYYHRFLAPPDVHEQEVLAALRANSDPGEAIFVFGYSPRLYWLADRPPAIRYIGTEKVAQLGRNAQPVLNEIIADLEKAEPKVIVLDSARVSASRSIGGLDTGRLADWIDRDYRPVPGLEEVRVRRGPAAG